VNKYMMVICSCVCPCLIHIFFFQFLEHVSDDEGAVNFQPSSSSNFCGSVCDFLTGNHVLRTGNCMGQKDIKCNFFGSDFKPSNSVQKFVSRSEISSHISFS
jgi:hypothetical protein